ncbi:RICIN domain-containing protein [Kitasatospora sp. LaBMicrA B282]|uniref:RICIN domain-containing protein n=1 Tax=Kitasatospora sp. LaBMicrA B282 TaxID=3420949 RepID=UPI003D0B3787
MALEVPGSSPHAGTQLDTWAVNGNTNQLWTLTPLSNGSYLVSSVCSGLMLTAASSANGAALTQQVSINSPQQQWTIS